MAPIMFTRIYLNIRKLLVDSCNVEYLVNGCFKRPSYTRANKPRYKRVQIQRMKLLAERISPRPLIENSRRMPRTRASRGNELDSTEADRRVDAPEAGFGGETRAE